MRIIEEKKLGFEDVLVVPKRSELNSRKEVDLQRFFKYRNGSLSSMLVPIMASNMNTVSTLEAAKVFEKYKIFTCLHKFISLDDILKSDLNPELFAITFGLKDTKIIEQLKEKREISNIKYLCLDVANGYTKAFSDFVQYIREEFPEYNIIAGNVATPEMTQQLILDGADIVKVGIGPGNHCTTRKQTGVGYPQLSAIIECADAAHGLGGQIIADGGCRTPGDVAKAFGGGADFVMIGSMFAGHIENSSFNENGETLVYGMSSTEAMKKFYGKVDDYRTSEGRISVIKNRGSLETTITDLLGGLRSACTYIGARTIKDFSKCTTFVLTTSQYSKEYEDKTIGY